MDNTYAIQAFELTKYYGDLLAVDHIDFAVHRGEIFGFLGPKGAGKTTTIRMLTTLLEPTEGTARINGYDITHQAYEAKHQFGIVPEESNVYTELSAWDNLIFTACLYRVPRKEREQRAHELDEPIAGLDAQSARAIRGLVQELNDGGTTIFLTTHQIEVASQLCDRVAIIHHGQIAAIDTPEHLKRAIQSVQSVEVAFDRWEGQHREELAQLPGVSAAVREGDKIRLPGQDRLHRRSSNAPGGGDGLRAGAGTAGDHAEHPGPQPGGCVPEDHRPGSRYSAPRAEGGRSRPRAGRKGVVLPCLIALFFIPALKLHDRSRRLGH